MEDLDVVSVDGDKVDDGAGECSERGDTPAARRISSPFCICASIIAFARSSAAFCSAVCGDSWAAVRRSGCEERATEADEDEDEVKSDDADGGGDMGFTGEREEDVLGWDGRCKRHIIHGMMKYRGSTRGAVMSESAVDRIQIRKKDVLGPSQVSLRIRI